MKVRVHDKDTNKYFRSEVYAIIRREWHEQYLVLVPGKDATYFKFFDYLDRSEDGHPVNVNIITPGVPENWVRKDSESLTNIKSARGAEIRLDYFRGYPWIFQNTKLLASLIEGQSIAYNDTDFKLINSNIEGWNYIENQDDVNNLLSLYYGFHDSVLKSLSYISGAEVEENGGMVATDYIREVTMIFDSQCNKSIEMVFEGVLALNLRPAKDNYTSDIFDASLIIVDESIFFCDEYMETEDLRYEGTWIKSLALRWRLL